MTGVLPPGQYTIDSLLDFYGIPEDKRTESVRLYYQGIFGVLPGQRAAVSGFRTVVVDAAGNRSVHSVTQDARGDRIETTYQGDGSWHTAVQDRAGNRTTTYYSAGGVLVRDEWSKVNGAHGTDAFFVDGSSIRTSDSNATGHTVVKDDGQGHVTHIYQSTGRSQRLVGSGSNDTFIVDHEGVTIDEPVGGSNALVRTSLEFFRVPDHVDQIVLTGNREQRVVGNGADDSFAVNGGAGSYTELYLGNGNNTVSSGDGDITVHVGAGNNDLILGNGNNVVDKNRFLRNPAVGDGNNQAYLGNGDNEVELGNGNNIVGVGTGDNKIAVGNGNNTLYAGHGAGTNNITFGDGDNVVTVGDGDNTVEGGNGRNTIWGGNGINYVNVGNGDDTIGLGNGDNTVGRATAPTTCRSAAATTRSRWAAATTR